MQIYNHTKKLCQLSQQGGLALICRALFIASGTIGTVFRFGWNPPGPVSPRRDIAVNRGPK